jgi:ATP-dependent phosphofructokinase / diphosphate-dependent phosphofructokinase
MGKNLLITMSGGTTTVINATLAGIIQQSSSTSFIERIYAGFPGLLGVLNEDLVDLTDIDDRSLESLKITPGSGFIGTTRIAPVSDNEIKRLHDVFQAYDIGFFVNIGGNGSIKQTCRIAAAIDRSVLKVVAAPKTVDNDMGDVNFQDVYFTPGFPSCVQYWIHKLFLLNQDNLGAWSHDRVVVAQTFGRRTGFLAGCVRVADPDRKLPLVLLLPEDQQPLDRVMTAIDTTLSQFSRAIVVLSEGYDLGDLGGNLDPSGQIMYGSSTTTAAQLLVNNCMRYGIQARGFIPAMDQRLEIILSSSFDLDHAFYLGQFVINSLEEGYSHFLASIARARTQRPKLIRKPLIQIRDYSRTMPQRWLDQSNYDVTNGYVDYLKSMIYNGHPMVPYAVGVPTFLKPFSPLASKKLPPWQNPQLQPKCN